MILFEGVTGVLHYMEGASVERRVGADVVVWTSRWCIVTITTYQSLHDGSGYQMTCDHYDRPREGNLIYRHAHFDYVRATFGPTFSCDRVTWPHPTMEFYDFWLEYEDEITVFEHPPTHWELF